MIDRIDEVAREQRDIPTEFARTATAGRHLVLWALQYLRQIDGLDTALRAFEARRPEDLDVRLARAALEELRTPFRSRYEITYTATGKEPGWHAVDVRIPARRGATVHARRGYQR